MNTVLPISPAYRNAVFDALAIQALIAVFSGMILDCGQTARGCGIALLAFWGGAAVLICRRPLSPTRIDIELIRFGYLPVIALTFFVANYAWHLRGLL